MAYEVVPAVQETIARLETLSEESANGISRELSSQKDEDHLINVIASYLDTSVMMK